MSDTDIPSEGATRLERGTFTSGLSVPDFAACLHMGMRPVGLVQGYCVMKWAWYMTGSPYNSTTFWSGASNSQYLTSYNCPHGFSYGYGRGQYGSGYGLGQNQAPAEHRVWGCNVQQSWVTQAWASGYNAAFRRMVQEAQDAGAHGVVGVIDSSSHLIEGAIREFHMYGTAVVVEDADRPEQIWTSYLAGERLAKLVEAGFFPVSVVAGMASVRVWSVCATEILTRGLYDQYGGVRPTDEIRQISDAEMQARRLARDQIKANLGPDMLQGAAFEGSWEEISEGDFERTCTLRGTRVRRVREAEPLPAPIPTVVLR